MGDPVCNWVVSNPSPRDPGNSEKKNFRTELRSIWENALTLPKTIRSIVRFPGTVEFINTSNVPSSVYDPILVSTLCSV